MWRKPDAKPSSGMSTDSSSMPSRTQSAVRPQQPSLERPAYAPAPKPAAEPVSPDASRISAGLKIKGEISGSSDLYLDGEAIGKIRLAGARVTIGQTGKVKADIDAREIVINGSVHGNLKAEDRLRLGSSSEVDGTMAAPNVGIEDGARFHGKVEVTRKSPAPSYSEPESTGDAELLKPVGAHVEGE
jgi:cytoskeletal protein CcmA (bactofilin family)